MRLERLKIASSAEGGFGVDFNLGNMNFGPDSDLGLSNSGRRDGYYVNAASFQGFTDLGFLGASVAPAGDVDGDGVACGVGAISGGTADGLHRWCGGVDDNITVVRERITVI